MSVLFIENSSLTNIANAIREKTGATAKLSLEQMPNSITAIESGLNTSDATATAADILKDKIAYAKDVRLTGTMNNKGAATCSLSYGGSYTNTAGYYSSITITPPSLSGNASAGQVLSGQTFMNSAGVQTGSMNNKGAASCSLGYGGTYTGAAGYYSSVSVTAPSRYGNATAAQVLSGYTFMNTGGNQTGSISSYTIDSSVGVGGTYSNTTAGYYTSIKVAGPTLSGNATAANVLSGATFYAANGTKQTGTMVSKSAVTCALGYGGTYSGTAGYYSSVSVTSPGRYGNATNAYVLSGKTFMNTSGNQTGAMANKGAASCTSLAAGSTYTGTAGYYSSISVTAASVSFSGTAEDWRVMYPYTFYNTSTTRYTGSLRTWTCSGDIITGSWKSCDLGWTPSWYGVACTENTKKLVKCYRSGTTLWWCLNGSGTFEGKALAIGGID